MVKPVTPPQIPVSDYQSQMGSPGSPIYFHGNGVGVWRAIATGMGGLCVGLLIAWFTAIRERGITQEDLQKFREEMHDYVSKYTPYSFDKQIIAETNSRQDGKMGEINGKQERLLERMANAESKQHEDERDRDEIKSKLKFLGDTLEGLKVRR